ncbi:Sodium/potassium-transporting ATPase subunit beta-1-interacting protein [Nymphon striatum]|nr:Sodium/potassium-transporting ATPase subunit beta-1-interacting protein [Nymphon striatum]
MMKKADMNGGVTVYENKTINKITYADDTVLIAENARVLGQNAQRSGKEGKKWSIEINKDKTKVMMVTNNKQQEDINIKLDGVGIQQVDKFQYLGVFIDNKLDHKIDVKCAVARAKDAFLRHKEFFRINISTVTRQVFDFLGYMWAPIIANFLCIICAILGFFGVYQFRAKYIIVHSEILNIGTGSKSWWHANGIGCHAKYNDTGNLNGNGITANASPSSQIVHPSSVEGCLVQYQYVECIQAALQILFSLLVLIGSSYILYKISTDDDSLKISRPGSALPPYSIEYQHHPHPPEPNDGPMTPRKVKRRSTSRNSTRGSQKSNRRYRNPVTKMIDRSFETSSNDSFYMPGNFYRRDPAGGVSNLAFDHTNNFVMNFNGRGMSHSMYADESETVI